MFNIKSKFSKSDKLFLSNKSRLIGQIEIPGDKSISQRALIIGLISNGNSKIQNILESEDVIHTMRAVILLGGKVSIKNDILEIRGVGLGNITSPPKPVYMGNSGTGTRLLLGVVAGSNATVTFYGDGSLTNRPMSRVITPLKKMGAKFVSHEEGRLPLTVIGARRKGIILPIEYTTPMPSAQVKSSLILASLTARGTSKIIEKSRTRNNTEEMLINCGVKIISRYTKNKRYLTQLEGMQYINSFDVRVPGDPSTAAFLAVAAIITKNSKIELKNIYYDKFRLKIFFVLKKMGAKIDIKKNNRGNCDITVESSNLKNLIIPAKDSSALIDEYPILSIAASSANGKMIMKGLKELRFKESDRLTAIFKGLSQSGIKTELIKDTLIIQGRKNIRGGNIINASNDHRMAMSFNILSLITKSPIIIKGNSSIRTSFPLFFDSLSILGVNIKRDEN